MSETQTNSDASPKHHDPWTFVYMNHPVRKLWKLISYQILLLCFVASCIPILVWHTVPPHIEIAHVQLFILFARLTRDEQSEIKLISLPSLCQAVTVKIGD